jgi:hypothetical protein
MGFASIAILLGTAIMPAVGWAMAVLGAALVIGATVSAQQVVSAVDAAQAEYFESLRAGR